MICGLARAVWNHPYIDAKANVMTPRPLTIAGLSNDGSKYTLNPLLFGSATRRIAIDSTFGTSGKSTNTTLVTSE